jgi:hypothetical protein
MAVLGTSSGLVIRTRLRLQDASGHLKLEVNELEVVGILLIVCDAHVA